MKEILQMAWRKYVRSLITITIVCIFGAPLLALWIQPDIDSYPIKTLARVRAQLQVIEAAAKKCAEQENKPCTRADLVPAYLASWPMHSAHPRDAYRWDNQRQLALWNNKASDQLSGSDFPYWTN
jgi:hypothetical protein